MSAMKQQGLKEQKDRVDAQIKLYDEKLKECESRQDVKKSEISKLKQAAAPLEEEIQTQDDKLKAVGINLKEVLEDLQSKEDECRNLQEKREKQVQEEQESLANAVCTNEANL